MDNTFYLNVFLNNNNAPSKEEREQFWRGILGEEKHHDDKAQWITREEAKYAQVDVVLCYTMLSHDYTLYPCSITYGNTHFRISDY